MSKDFSGEVATVNNVPTTYSGSNCKWFESYCPACDWILVWSSDDKPENKCWACSGELQPTTHEQQIRCPLFIHTGADYAALEIMLRRLNA